MELPATPAWERDDTALELRYQGFEDETLQRTLAYYLAQESAAARIARRLERELARRKAQGELNAKPD